MRSIDLRTHGALALWSMSVGGFFNFTPKFASNSPIDMRIESASMEGVGMGMGGGSRNTHVHPHRTPTVIVVAAPPPPSSAC